MSKRGNLELLKDIDEAMKRIGVFTDGMDYDGFLSDIKTQDAVVRNIEIIGEAVKKKSPPISRKNMKISNGKRSLA